jgi:phosphatidylserine/phosphatidylglycerophosphate/cardiolipin synthase-like enzyme
MLTFLPSEYPDFTSLAITVGAIGTVTIVLLLGTWHLQPWITHCKMATKIPQHIYELCASTNSITSEYASDTSVTPGHICNSMFHVHKNRYQIAQRNPSEKYQTATAEDLELAMQCGKWGPTKPSELFLRIYHDAVLALETDPLMGCVSPSLMGSYGVIPLSIIAPLPDICRHMSNLIARAEKEVFLATNYWMDSEASALITNALRELSRRAVAENRTVVVKIIYDRGHLKQVDTLL